MLCSNRRMHPGTWTRRSVSILAEHAGSISGGITRTFAPDSSLISLIVDPPLPIKHPA